MPSPHDTAYTARFELPELIERGASNTLRCAMYRDGDLVAPTGVDAVVVQLFDASGTLVLEANEGTTPAVAITDTVATYVYVAPTTLQLGEGYRLVWTLGMPDGRTHTVENDAAVVRHRLLCPVSSVDLYRRMPSLDPSRPGNITGAVTDDYQTALDDAWLYVQRRLIELGNRPNLILGAHALREATLMRWLHVIFEGLSAGRNNAAYMASADRYAREFDLAFGRALLHIRYGDVDEYDPKKARSAVGTYWLQ